MTLLAEIEPADVYARVNELYNVVIVLAVVVALLTVSYVVKTYRGWNLPGRVVALLESSEDLAALSRHLLGRVGDKADTAANAANATARIVVKTGNEIKGKLAEVQQAVADGTASQSGTSLPTVPPLPTLPTDTGNTSLG